jgi:ATP-binding cassette, subfamily B, bacterial
MKKLFLFIKNWRKQSEYLSWLVTCSVPYIPRIMLLIMFGLLDTVLSVGLAIILKNIIDSASTHGIITQAIILYIGLVLMIRLVNWFNLIISFLINERFTFEIRKKVYDQIIKAYWMDIKKYHSGDLMTRLMSDVDIIADGIINVIPTIIQLILELLVTFFTLFYFEPRLAIFALLLGPVSAVICLVLGRKLKFLQIKVQTAESKYRSYIQESLGNILIIKAFTNEEYANRRLTEERNERLFWMKKKNKLAVTTSTVLSFTFQIGYIGAFTLGSFQLAKDAITFGTMSVFLNLVNRIQSPIISLANVVPRIVSVLASAGRIMEVVNIPQEKQLMTKMNTSNIGVEVDNLSFGYTDELVLEDISFSVLPGEFVAILGASGIGKTTLVKIIMSFLLNSCGEVSFVNELGEKVTANAGARKMISYVPQGNTLFSGTIRDNILMGKLDATENEINEALELSASKTFVDELPDGVNTVIGERGHGISEGQAQRIAIARALIRKSPFLILDEATSALDENTELYVLEGIQKLNPRPACLIITHRRSVLKYCNRELLIENKKVSENII